MLPVSDAEKLVHAFMTSRLDYCNAVLGGCPASSINKLQVVQNAAARVLTRSRKYDHITPILQSLHWLPIKYRISYKIKMTEHLRRDDANPSEDLRGCQPLIPQQHTELTNFAIN